MGKMKKQKQIIILNDKQSGINVAPGINIAPGKFGKNIKRSP